MPRCRSCSRTCRRSRPSWSRTSCRRRSPSPASSACCRSCSPSASRSATSPPSSKASPTAIAVTRNPASLAEHVRARLARQICAQHTSPSGYLPLIALSAEWEQAFAESIDRPGRRPPARDAALEAVGVHHAGARALRGGGARGRGAGAASPRPASGRSCAGIVERFRAQTPVLSQAEIHPRARLKTVGSV